MGGKFYSHSYKVSVEKTRLQCSQLKCLMGVQMHQVRVAESNAARNTDRCAPSNPQRYLRIGGGTFVRVPCYVGFSHSNLVHLNTREAQYVAVLQPSLVDPQKS
jgi:hypothetical protein